ncbi:hypothetical protein ACFL6U_04805 [Planctomycetota bacterium]
MRLNVFGMLLLVSVAGIPSVSAQIPLPQNRAIPLHHFDLACNTCHENSSRSETYNDRNPNDTWEIAGDISSTCSQPGCHTVEGELNHPLGVSANIHTPAEMPLDDQGRITCLTCHLESSTTASTDNLDDQANLRLYRPEGIEFCASCHMDMGTSIKEQSHWRFSARAHLLPLSDQFSHTSDRLSVSVSSIDQESRTCMSCHENVAVSTPYSRGMSNQSRAFGGASMANHPIGMSYTEAALNRRGGYYYPIMDQRIRLFDGQVGCGSCHSLYSRKKNLLVMSNHRSVLCLTCHNK